jgi:hypothetical protein
VAYAAADCTFTYSSSDFATGCETIVAEGSCTLVPAFGTDYYTADPLVYSCDISNVLSPASAPTVIAKSCDFIVHEGADVASGCGDAGAAVSLAPGGSCVITATGPQWYIEGGADTYSCVAGTDLSFNNVTLTSADVREWPACRLLALHTGVNAGDCDVSTNFDRAVDGTVSSKISSGSSCTYTLDTNFDLVTGGDSLIFSCAQGVSSLTSLPAVKSLCYLPAIFPPGVNTLPNAKQVAAARPSAEATLCSSALQLDSVTNTACFVVLKTGWVTVGGSTTSASYSCDTEVNLVSPTIVKTGKPRSLKEKIFN